MDAVKNTVNSATESISNAVNAGSEKTQSAGHGADKEAHKQAAENDNSITGS